MQQTMTKIKRFIKSGISVIKTKRVIPISVPIDDNHMLEHKVALIIGGSGGIGMAIARSYIASGCNVIISGTKPEKLMKCCEELGKAKWIVLDLLKIEDLAVAIQNAFNFYGRIDILVISSGVHSNKVINDIWEVTEDEYDNVMGINLKGTYFVCQNVAKHMKASKIKGNVLLISSSRAIEPAFSPYSLSKWGIKGFTLGLAEKLLPYGIVVNSIAPGSTATEMIGVRESDSIFCNDNRVGRYVVPDEVAHFAKLMVSDLGNMIVGETLYISGGRGIIDIR
jgi:3-oxoacyl-[acyl-carrier protein] reductase